VRGRLHAGEASSSARLSELFRLVVGASFLDAPGALNHAQRALASRLKRPTRR
jgi:hypothetical protein